MLETKNLRVVTADDDEVNLYILLKSLKDAGHESKGFTDGDEILEYLVVHPEEVDIVILDKMMARVSGIEVIKRMKEHPILKKIPTILQTGDAAPERIKEGLDSGADGYITKPFKPAELLVMIDGVIRDSGLKGA